MHHVRPPPDGLWTRAALQRISEAAFPRYMARSRFLGVALGRLRCSSLIARVPWWLLSAACLSGCAGVETIRYTAPSFYSSCPYRVAVLPFDNESVDLLGPELLRRFVHSGLSGEGYESVPVERVDDILRSTIGITDGGQLGAIAPIRIGEALGADGLMYGVVEAFTFLNVGFAVRRVVRLHLKLVLASTGETLWEDSGEGLTEFFTLKKKEAWRAFTEGVAARGVENALRTPLMPEAQEAVRRLFLSLPARAPRALAPIFQLKSADHLLKARDKTFCLDFIRDLGSTEFLGFAGL